MYGKGTSAAVKAYQKRKKLSADGIVGGRLGR
ncbi:peptidoglycan-binding domain-containing protein [Peribacillus sp. ACCC06369]